MKKLLTLLLLISPIAALQAAKLNPAHIAGDSKWMIHLDIDAVLASEIGQDGKSKLQEPAAKEKLQAIKEAFGIDLEKGLHGVTAYGNGDRDNGVLIAHADADKQKLLNFAKLNEGYEKSSYNGHKIHSIDDKRKQTHVCFHSPGTIVVAQTKDLVQKGVDLLDGKNAAIKVNKGMRSISEELDNPMMIAYGDFSGIKEITDNPKAAMLKMASSTGIAVGESLGIVKAAMFLEAVDADSCQQIESIVRGIMALGSLQRDKQPDLAKLSNAFNVERKENLLKVVFRMDTQDLIQIGENMEKQHRESRHRWHEKKKRFKSERK